MPEQQHRNENIRKITDECTTEDSHTTAIFINNNDVYTTAGHNISLSQMGNIVKEYCLPVQN